ncbi:hypothetical protein MPER_04436, partial [Moniliophthora perniciosa FA553]
KQRRSFMPFIESSFPRVNLNPDCLEVYALDPSLGSNAKPLFLLIYADKNKLVNIRDRKGISSLGGGWVVGWHPFVPEDAQHSGKKGFADFKGVVWHESALKMFESLLEYSQIGCVIKCGDGITRHLFPVLYVLSADYEEQTLRSQDIMRKIMEWH